MAKVLVTAKVALEVLLDIASRSFRTLVPLYCTNYDQCLQGMAAGIVARSRGGDENSQSNPATEPEAAGGEFDKGNGEFMREAREGQRGEAEVGNHNGGCPAAVEEHEIDDIGVGPFVVERCDF